MYDFVTSLPEKGNPTHILYVRIADTVHICGVSENQGKTILANCTGVGHDYRLEPLINPYADKIHDVNDYLWSDGTHSYTSDIFFYCNKCHRSFILPASADIREWQCPCCGNKLHSISYSEYLLELTFAKMDLPKSYKSDYANDPYIKQMVLNDLKNLEVELKPME